jgi:hypothetical protein
MFALGAFRLIRFSAVALFPPPAVEVVMVLDKAACPCQHACHDHGKTQASHKHSSPQV